MLEEIYNKLNKLEIKTYQIEQIVNNNKQSKNFYKSNKSLNIFFRSNCCEFGVNYNKNTHSQGFLNSLIDTSLQKFKIL